MGALVMTKVTLVTDTNSQAHELRVLVYSDDRRIRDAVMTGLGRRPAKDLAKIEFIQVATEPVVKRELNSVDLSRSIYSTIIGRLFCYFVAINPRDVICVGVDLGYEVVVKTN